MNIKRAKEEIKNTIQAYLLKDEYGEYRDTGECDRDLYLLYWCHPGIGKTQIMEQIARECRSWTGILYHYPPYQAECRGTSFHIQKRI